MQKLTDLNKQLLDLNEQLRLENDTLRQAYDKILKENHSLKVENLQLNKGLEKVFTSGQIRALKSDKKCSKWAVDDIASAISLRSVSPKAYRYLRAHNHPLPGLSTLRTWAKKLNLDQGVLEDIMILMKNKSRDFNDLQRLTILCFDEVYVSNKICIDKKYQQKVGPHKSCQTVMARGLMSQWKQPVFYQFDQPMTVTILNDIISSLYNSGFIVAAVTADMGIGNMSLWSKLGISHETHCFFKHPSDENLKIFVFADVPHLLKLIRNHFIDTGFKYKDKLMNKFFIERLLHVSNSELTIAHKISQYHLDVKGTERQKVRPAAQLFSNTVSKAIAFCGAKKIITENGWQETAELVKLINDWFDLFNSRCKYGSHVGLHAFGVEIENQISLLKSVSELISSIKVGRHQKLIPFQKGILLSNESLIQMYNYLHEVYNVEYILTNRLNQDVLENFFSYIRGMGGANDHPTPLDFKYRLRWYILGKHSAALFVQSKNTEDVSEPCLLNPLKGSDSDECVSQGFLSKLCQNIIPAEVSEEEETVLIDSTFIQPDYTEMHRQLSEDCEVLLEAFETEMLRESINEEALRFIAGYAASRFRNKYSNLGDPTKLLPSTKGMEEETTWIQFLSKGNLIYPSDDLLLATKALDKEFTDLHGSSLCSEKFMFNRLVEKTRAKLPKEIEIADDVLACLARTRTYIRLRELNRKISIDNSKKKLNKKMYKITNVKKYCAKK